MRWFAWCVNRMAIKAAPSLMPIVLSTRRPRLSASGRQLMPLGGVSQHSPRPLGRQRLAPHQYFLTYTLGGHHHLMDAPAHSMLLKSRSFLTTLGFAITTVLVILPPSLSPSR